eukprot:106789-Karenia_brevis.AAC.1
MYIGQQRPQDGTDAYGYLFVVSWEGGWSSLIIYACADTADCARSTSAQNFVSSLECYTIDLKQRQHLRLYMDMVRWTAGGHWGHFGKPGNMPNIKGGKGGGGGRN